MATADRSPRANPLDARIPCPVCGQQIHPVAGRCKHCKTDLVKLRDQRGLRAPRVAASVLAAAEAAPPPESRIAPAAAPAVLAGGVAAPPIPDATPAPAPLLAPAYDAYPQEAYAPPRSALARRWPIAVAVVAGVAIVVCAYLLLFDHGGAAASAKSTHKGAATPAPDRMDTQPAPPPPPSTNPLPDPWGGSAPQGTAPHLPPNFDDPPAPGQAPPPATPDPNTAPNPTPPSTAPGAAPPAEEYLSTLQELALKKLGECGLGGALGGSTDVFTQLFGGAGMADQLREMVRNGRCQYDQARAASCIASVQGIQCQGGGLDLDKLEPLLMGLGDCMQALSCQ